METALLVALCLCIALFVYALRVAGERNRLRDEVQAKRTESIVVYGASFAGDSARQRALRAQRVVESAKAKSDPDLMRYIANRVGVPKRKRRK